MNGLMNTLFASKLLSTVWKFVNSQYHITFAKASIKNPITSYRVQILSQAKTICTSEYTSKKKMQLL